MERASQTKVFLASDNVPTRSTSKLLQPSCFSELAKAGSASSTSPSSARRSTASEGFSSPLRGYGVQAADKEAFVLWV